MLPPSRRLTRVVAAALAPFPKSFQESFQETAPRAPKGEAPKGEAGWPLGGERGTGPGPGPGPGPGGGELRRGPGRQARPREASTSFTTHRNCKKNSGKKTKRAKREARKSPKGPET